MSGAHHCRPLCIFIWTPQEGPLSLETIFSASPGPLLETPGVGGLGVNGWS